MNIKFDYNSPVIITYLVLSVIACFLNYITHGKSNKHLFSAYYISCIDLAHLVELLSRVQLFATTWTAACQPSLSFTVSWNLLKLMSIE